MKQFALLSKFIILGSFDNVWSSHTSDSMLAGQLMIFLLSYVDHKSFSGIDKDKYVNKSTLKSNNFNLRSLCDGTNNAFLAAHILM